MNNKMVNIYFIPSYVCLNNFFSIIDLSKKSIVFCSSNEDLYEFLNLLLKGNDVKIIKIGNVLKKGMMTDKKFFDYIVDIDIKEQIDKIDKIYYFCKEWTLDIFVLLDKLKNYGEVIFIDSENDNFKPKYEITNLGNFYYFLVVTFQSIILNLNIRPVMLKHTPGLSIRYEESYSKRQKFKCLTWDEIKHKFNWHPKISKPNGNKSILYIHEELVYLKGIHVDKSLLNIIKFLERMREKGFTISVKGHPKHKLEKGFENFTILPSFIPVEFFENNYDLYFTENSVGIKKFLVTNKAYTLLNYLVFEDSGSKQNFLNYLNENLYGINILNNQDEINENCNN